MVTDLYKAALRRLRRKPDVKIMYLDLETTGKHYWKHGIHQISGAIEINGKIKEYFNYRVKPNRKAEIDIVAMRMADLDSPGSTDSFMEMKECFEDIKGMLSRYVNKFNPKDKMWICAYNGAPFDKPFFRAFFVQNGEESFEAYFYPACLDVMVLTAQKCLQEGKGIPRFKLKNIAEHFGIVVDESRLHEAQYDTDLLIQIYKKLIL